MYHDHKRNKTSNNGHTNIKERSLGLAYTFKIHLELHEGNHSDHGFCVFFLVLKSRLQLNLLS